MISHRHFAALWAGLVLMGLLSTIRATETVEPGTRFDSLPVGSTIYQQVVVRSVTARTVVITHAGGMASIRLHDLSPEWQARFRYDPAAESAAEPAARIAPAPALPARPARATTATSAASFETLLQQFGKPAVIQTDVDPRPKFFQLELGVKNQGRRPSCSIFAIVSALEFQNAGVTGKVEKFSEEYLIWATRRTVQRIPAASVPAADETTKDDADEGFTLTEVVAAIRAYGIPLQSSMPNTFGRKIEAIEDPPAGIIKEARAHERVFVHLLPGRDRATRLNNIVHALNAGTPVAVGMAWPNYRSLRTGYLAGQKPMAGSGHAVTLVGYKSPSGRIEDAVFIFKNFWGVNWGQGGYGTATYAYLSNNLSDAVLLEVQPG